MQSGRCCNCNHRIARPVNIKAISIVDGVTEWEYGLASYWSHHYGLDAITGVEADSTALKDRYVLCLQRINDDTIFPGDPSTVGPTEAHNRNTSTCVANCSESLYLTKLNSLTGSVTTKTLVPGWYVKNVYLAGASFETFNSAQSSAVGLSGGNYALQGRLQPSIEFVNFTSNTINKTYILNAHGMQVGQVYLKTRTSNETMIISYNQTAAVVKMIFEATADCVSATVTGGPWPLLPITVAAVWSVAGGDIKSIDADYYTIVGAATKRITFSTWRVYDTATGLLTSTAGYVFGTGTGKSAAVFPANSALAFTFTTPAVRGGFNGYAGQGNNIVITQGSTLGATIECWNVSTTWALIWCKVSQSSAGGSTNFMGNFAGLEDGKFAVAMNRRTSQSNPTRTMIGATIGVTTGTVGEFDNTNLGISSKFGVCQLFYNNSAKRLFSNIRSTFNDVDPTGGAPISFQYHLDGFMHQVDATKLHLETDEILHADATQVYGAYYRYDPNSYDFFRYDPPQTIPPAFGLTSAKTFAHTFYTQPGTHMATGTQFRFVLGLPSNPQLITAWLDWHATAAQIQTALIDVILENTAGYGSSVQVWPFGEPAADCTNTISQLEKGLLIHFAGAPNRLTQAFLTQNFRLATIYFQRNLITIEAQNLTYRAAAAGIAAYTSSTGAVVWSRPYGTAFKDPPYSPARDVMLSYNTWLKADYLYGTGLVEDELP